MRFRGVSRAISCSISLEVVSSNIGVAIIPGQTVLTKIPSKAPGLAYILVKTEIAPLLASDGAAASGNNFVAQTPRLEMRCKSIWVMGDSAEVNRVSIIAGLTGIVEGAFPTLSGSNGFRGIG